MCATPITETYEDVRNLIYHVCNRFARRYGGDVEELFADANVAYLKAYESWQPGHGTKFSTYLSLCIWRRLVVIRKAEHRRRAVWLRRLDDVAQDQQPVAGDRSIGDRFAELVEDLSSDAADVVKLVFATTSDIAQMAEEKGGGYRNWRSSIRSHLRKNGWTHDRIRTTFEEITGALV